MGAESYIPFEYTACLGIIKIIVVSSFYALWQRDRQSEFLPRFDSVNVQKSWSSFGALKSYCFSTIFQKSIWFQVGTNFTYFAHIESFLNRIWAVLNKRCVIFLYKVFLINIQNQNKHIFYRRVFFHFSATSGGNKNRPEISIARWMDRLRFLNLNCTLKTNLQYASTFHLVHRFVFWLSSINLILSFYCCSISFMNSNSSPLTHLLRDWLEQCIPDRTNTPKTNWLKRHFLILYSKEVGK